jgi:ABC-type polar amino acid transport system ATPase subunit
MIEFVDVSKAYKTQKKEKITVLNKFSFNFLFGETHVICGKSGAGKSTLIRCINYLEKIDHGRIFVEKIKVSAGSAKSIRKKVAMVFQDFNLFPHMSVLKNVIFGPVNSLHIDVKESVESAKEYLNKVDLIDKINSYPYELSGGQKQRVAIVRALNMHPDIILFDEPTSALDPEMIGEVLDVMKKLAKEGRSMIIVTHEMGFAREAAHRISFLEEGRFIETDTPDVFFNNPHHESVAKFIRQVQYQ